MDKSNLPLLSRRHGLAAIAAAGAIALPTSAGSVPQQPEGVVTSGFTDDPSTFWQLFGPATPAGKPTVLMVPGGGHTGACYLATADGRPGWAQRFLAAGYPVAVADWAGTGRSGAIPYDKLTGEVVCAGLAKVIDALGGNVVLLVHSMSGPYGWKLIEQAGDRIAKVVAIAPGPPGNIQEQADIVSETPSFMQIRGTTNFTLDRTAPFAATRGFVEGKMVGKSLLFPRDAIGRYADSQVLTPPLLIQQRLNVHGSQMRVTDFRHYPGKPVLVMTGDHDTDHPHDFDQATVDWLAQAGAKVDYWYLPDKGQVGNGHMMMLEQNSDALAQLIMSWLEAA